MDSKISKTIEAEILKSKTLIDLLEYRADNQPDAIAFRFYSTNLKEQTITYEELRRKAKSIATLLMQYGQVGDRVHIIFPPGIELIESFFGCLYAGMVGILVSLLTNSRLIEKFLQIVESSTPSIMLTNSDLRNRLDLFKNMAVKMNLNVATSCLNKMSVLNTNIEMAPLAKYPCIEEDSIAFIQYSSGSTRNPKGIMLSHGNLVNNLNIMYTAFELYRVDNIVSWLPPYHDLGIIGQILTALYIGKTANMISPMTFINNPSVWLDLISKNPNCMTAAPNFAYNLCVHEISDAEMLKANFDLSHWIAAINGAEPIHQKTLEAFYEKFKSVGFKKSAFYPAYGLAEATLAVSAKKYDEGIPFLEISIEELKNGKVVIDPNLESKDKKKCVNCGRLYQGVEIVNPETFEKCPEDSIGEVWIHDLCVAKGYWHDEKQTNEIFQATIHNDSSGKKYMRTGDLAFIHEGGLYFIARIKDIIDIHGLKYYPQDIEYAVEHCNPAIPSGGCASFSLDDVDDEEEHLAIVCEVMRNLNDEEYLSITHDIIEIVERDFGLSPYIILLIPKKTIPKTTSGKIRRKQCLENLRNNTFKVFYKYCVEDNTGKYASAEARNIDDMEEWLLQWMSHYTKLSSHKISCERLLAEYGMDSLGMIQLVAKIGEQFNIALNPEVVSQYPTIQKLATYLCHLPQGRSETEESTELAASTSNSQIVRFSTDHVDESKIRALQEISGNEMGIDSFQPRLIDLTGTKEGKLEVVYDALHYLKEKKVLGLTVQCIKGEPNYYLYPELSDKPIMSFFSCSYLGLERDERVVKGCQDLAEKRGVQLSSSWTIVSDSAYLDLENSLQKIVGIRPLVAHTTTLGSLSALPVLIGYKDAIIIDEQVHNSVQMASKLCLINGTPAIYIRHNSLEELENGIQYFRKKKARNIWYLADGLYSMRGDFAPMHALLYLQEKYDNFYTYIDDSHAFGWLGKQGEGYAAQFADNPTFDKTVLITSLSKVLVGSGGAMFMRNEKWRDKISVCGETMIFSGPIQIPILGTLLATTKILLSDEFPEMQKSLIENIDYLKNLLIERGIKTISSGKCPIFFVTVGTIEEACNLFYFNLKNGFYAPVIGFPAVPINQAGLRITINRLHTKEQIKGIVDSIDIYMHSEQRKSA